MTNISHDVITDVSSFLTANIEEFKKEAKEYEPFELEDSDYYGLQLTFAISEDGSQWNWQSGDNSYTGGAYSLPHWAVVNVDADSTIEGLVEEIISQWNELLDY